LAVRKLAQQKQSTIYYYSYQHQGSFSLPASLGIKVGKESYVKRMLMGMDLSMVIFDRTVNRLEQTIGKQWLKDK
jgi:hypothetical protein